MKSSELIRLLRQAGWVLIRQLGSQLILTNPVRKGQIVCPNHGSREVGKGLEKKIKRDAGIK
ncbi:MAG: type II toxin-antitoxin system HicA family toxin [Bacteroidota bacterium]